jgi:hypothetical protein
VTCQAPAVGGRAALGACATAAASVRLDGERIISADAAERRELAVTEALGDLLRARLAGRTRVARARIADEQAAAARDLQQSYDEAAERVRATGQPGAATTDRIAAIRDGAVAYGQLAAAIEAGDQAAYDDARAAAVDADERVWADVMLPAA